MENGKISNLVTHYHKQKQKHLALLWGFLLLVVGINLLFYWFIPAPFWQSLLLVFSLGGLFFYLIQAKAKLDHFDMQHRYYRLLASSEEPSAIKNRFDASWIEQLLHLGFKLVITTAQFAIYNRIQPSLSKRGFIKTNMLEFVTIFFDSKCDLYADTLEQEYRKIWFRLEKEHHLNKQVILQIKKYDEWNPAIKNELDRIIAYKEKDNYLITINGGYLVSNQTFYFLHSKTYHPNLYYKYAVDLMLELIK